MPPPPRSAELSDTVLRVSVSSARFSMPPPSLAAALPLTVQWTRVSLPKLRMPAPCRSVFPFRSVRFASVTVAPSATRRIRKAGSVPRRRMVMPAAGPGDRERGRDPELAPAVRGCGQRDRARQAGRERDRGGAAAVIASRNVHWRPLHTPSPGSAKLLTTRVQGGGADRFGRWRGGRRRARRRLILCAGGEDDDREQHER